MTDRNAIAREVLEKLAEDVEQDRNNPWQPTWFDVATADEIRAYAAAQYPAPCVIGGVEVTWDGRQYHIAFSPPLGTETWGRLGDVDSRLCTLVGRDLTPDEYTRLYALRGAR